MAVVTSPTRRVRMMRPPVTVNRVRSVVAGSELVVRSTFVPRQMARTCGPWMKVVMWSLPSGLRLHEVGRGALHLEVAQQADRRHVLRAVGALVGEVEADPLVTVGQLGGVDLDDEQQFLARGADVGDLA